jgi:hypothetical protein
MRFLGVQPLSTERKRFFLPWPANTLSLNRKPIVSASGGLPPGGQFVNLSMIDGDAIPYRFNISVNMQYFVRKVKAVAYFDDFADVEVTTEP